MISRLQKEKFLNQKAIVIWLTGLSGAGKTTLSEHLSKALFEKGFFTQLLDGDQIRNGINNNLGFSDEDRNENIRRIAEISKLFINSGIICINSFISPTDKIRSLAKEIIGSENYFEIYLDVSIEICEKRDVKGLYKAARDGKIKNFTGISSDYEIPTTSDLNIKTGELSIEDSVKICMDQILPLIQYSEK
jgi:adenylylsulfate kinase